MNLRWHYLAVALVAILGGLLFLQEPGFGDDLTYWSFAFDLHERGLVAWQKGSFHDLRWPVWGVCWLLQKIFGFGLFSYYGEPLLYLSIGAVVAFAFAHRVAGSIPMAWAAGLAFPFHPLLDTVCYRPMPDLSEGVLGGVVMLAWWAMVRSETKGGAFLFAFLTGLSLFVLEANRIMGAFIVPVLIVATLAFYPRKFGWLVLAGVFTIVFYAGLAAFYHWRFGDWLHDIHANLKNSGAKGTEFPNPWKLPFRFFDTLWKGNPLAPAYCILAAVGIWRSWRSGVAGRLMVLWFALLFFTYSCAPQSLSPYRPMIRDADRFLAGLSIPMSVLAAVGLITLFQPTWLGRWKAGAWLAQRPIVAGLLAFIVMAAGTSRERFSLGFVPEMRRYLDNLPDGTRVFSHKAMREFVYLVSADDAERLHWEAPNEILHRTPQLEQIAASCQEFWYARKLVWLTTRKKLERKELPEQPALGSYLDTPEKEWQLSGLFAKSDNPDLIFYRRRTPESPAPVILEASAPEWQPILPALPATWEGGSREIPATWSVPASLRGKFVRFELQAGSEQVEALAINLQFKSGKKWREEYLLKPYLYPQGGKEFFALPIPADVDGCDIELRFSKNAKRVTFTSLRAIAEPMPAK